MREYFHRQIQLWGEEKQDALQTKSIAIIGAGGLGTSLAIALGSSGIGTIYLIDFDEVEIHNIHRQIAFTMDDKGKSKAKTTAKLIESRCPYTKVIAYHESFENFCQRNIQVDIMIDATDNLPVRAAIDKHATKTNTPWIYGSVEAFNGQVCFIEQSDFSAFKISDKTPEGIATPIVMHIASLQANLALRYLVGLPIKKDLLYYLYFDKEGEFQTQKFKMPISL
jgi:molybdopterin/thiamine biosynthesis adenylyltransferase